MNYLARWNHPWAPSGFMPVDVATRCFVRTLALGAVLTLLSPAVAFAHEFWLSSVAHPDVESGGAQVYAFVGEGLRGDAVRFSAPDAESLRAYFVGDSGRISGARPETSSGPTGSTDLIASASHGDFVFAELPPAPESRLITYVSRFAEHEMDGESFDAYLETDGLWSILEERRGGANANGNGSGSGPVRERFRRSAKLYLPPTPDSPPPSHEWGDRGRATGQLDRSPRIGPCARLGLPLEIVPHQDPIGRDDVDLQVWYDGAPLVDAWVRAWHVPTADLAPLDGPSGRPRAVEEPVFGRKTSSDGRVNLDVSEPGEWLITVVHMVPSEDPSSDWESTWASFTFIQP